MIKKYDEMNKKDINLSIVVSWCITMISLVIYIALGVFLHFDYKWATIILLISSLSYTITSTIKHFNRGIKIQDEK